ncbi:MAG: twin-arginine translocase TatA/TatE family subunit [Pseudomonadota bacterium]
MAPSIWQILIVAILVVLLFGRGKISGLMGDVAKGIKSFKRGMAEDDSPEKVAQGPDEAVDVTPSTAAEPETAGTEAEKKDA